MGLFVNESIPPHIQRFILTSIDSVPHLEAILLLRNLDTEWTASGIAQRLFISEKKAGEILDDLCTAGFAGKKDGNAYHYDPQSPGLRETLDELNQVYPRHVVEISRFIHSKTDQQAKTFGDAFKWRT